MFNYNQTPSVIAECEAKNIQSETGGSKDNNARNERVAWFAKTTAYTGEMECIHIILSPSLTEAEKNKMEFIKRGPSRIGIDDIMYIGHIYSYGECGKNNWEVVQKAFDLLRQAGYIVHYTISKGVSKVSDFECLKELMIASTIERNAVMRL